MWGVFSRAAKTAATVRPMLGPVQFKPEFNIRDVFWKEVAARTPMRVLEVGTRRSDPSRVTHKRGAFPWVADSDYVRLDIRAGIDVDMIGDLHKLPPEWTGTFGCVIADAVFEHLERPWIAAQEMSRILAPGGLFLVVTHQCYPIHGHPNDFFRFSKEALRLIFEDAGLTVSAAGYSDQCMIVPPESIVPYEILDHWNREFPSYAMVMVTGRKP